MSVEGSNNDNGVKRELDATGTGEAGGGGDEAPSKKAKTETDDDGGPMVPPGTSGVANINDNDVLSGRGGGTNLHPGNRQFRDLINLYRRDYLKARKNDKPAISRSIVNAIREKGGRFLKKVEKTGLWFEIGDDAAREKTSQALRQRAPEMRKLLLDHEMEGARAQQQQQQMMMGMPGMAPMMMPGMNMMMMPNANMAFNPAMMGMQFNPAMMGMPAVGNYPQQQQQQSNSNNTNVMPQLQPQVPGQLQQQQQQPSGDPNNVASNVGGGAPNGNVATPVNGSAPSGNDPNQQQSQSISNDGNNAQPTNNMQAIPMMGMPMMMAMNQAMMGGGQQQQMPPINLNMPQMPQHQMPNAANDTANPTGGSAPVQATTM